MGKRQNIGSIHGAFEAALGDLGAWFERKQRVLPWRNDPSLYRVWVSEIMLQQTQVVTVKPYFERFIARFPSLESLASAQEADVLAQWAGLGYYSRARNLHKAAQKIAQSGFPTDRAGWLGIPGVGDYTAGAILSIALDQPEAILDGNVERVLSRLRRVSRKAGDAAYKARLWRLSRAFVQRGAEVGVRPRVLNQALMELGATICTPKKPLCPVCPVAGICRARASSEQEAYPPKKKPKTWLEVREELDCVLDGNGRVLLKQRQAGEWRAGLWDLPSISDAAKRRPGFERIGQVETRHVVTRHKITRVTRVWQPRDGGPLHAAEASSGARWVSIADPEVAVGSALKRTLQAVLERLDGGDRRA